MDHVSDIKLIRTDTTLDLSQKAEKGMRWLGRQRPLLDASTALHCHMGFNFVASVQAIFVSPCHFCSSIFTQFLASYDLLLLLF
ncbi:hypothetical protein KP509_1Z217800 [Ceratopteris richardii]|nr:hypothetical protein KP509_1Z217800 [Ceratopteris richardii]